MVESLTNMARQLFGAPVAQTATQAAPKKRTIKKGSADEALLKLLVRANGQFTVEQLAHAIPRRRKGRGANSNSPTVSIDSLKVQVSKVLNIAKDMGTDEAQIAKITPKGYATQRRGGEEYSADDLSGLFDVDAGDLLSAPEGE